MSAFARSLRHKALARIKRSEKLATAYRPRRWRWYKVSATYLVLPLVFLWPAFMLTMFVLGPIAFEVWDGKPTEYRPPALLGLAAHAHVVGGILALMIAGSGRTLFCEGLPWLAYFPCRDSDAVRRTNPMWLAYLLAAGVWSYYVFRCVGIYHEGSLSQSLLLVPLAALQAAMIYATAVVAIVLIRPAAKREYAMSRWAFLSLIGYAACMLSMVWPKQTLPPLLAAYVSWPQQPPAWLESLATLSGLLLPTGWVDAVVWYGVLQGQAWGWLFLLPCATLSALALWCRPRLVSLREIRVSSQGQLTPVFADDPEPETAGAAVADANAGRYQSPGYGVGSLWRKSSLHSVESVPAKDSRPPRVEQTTDNAPSVPPIDRQAVLKRLVSGPAFGKADWSAGWPLERLLGRLLTERERILVECLCGGVPNSTACYLFGLPFAAIWVVLCLVVFILSVESIPPTVLAKLATAPLVLLCVLALAPGKRRDRACVPMHPQFPVGFREMSLVTAKVVLAVLLAWLPIFVLALAAVAAALQLRPWPAGAAVNEGHDPLLDTLRYGGLLSHFAVLVALCLGVVGLHVLGISSRFVDCERYELSVHRVCYLAVLAIAVLAAVTMLLSPLWPVTLIAAAILLVSAVGIWRYFDWLYHSGRLDYVAWKPPRKEKR